MKFVNKLEVNIIRSSFFISALSEDENQLKAYEYGADDYITKPFKPSLLYAKCLALLKRNKKIKNEATSIRKSDFGFR